VLVMVSRLGKITVSGDRWFAARQYTGAIDLRPGASIDSLAIDRGVDQINANPYRHASVVAWPGEAVGTTDLQVRTEERFPATFRSSVGNTGTASTGLTQLNAGVDWGNAFGRGDQLSSGVLSSSDRHRLRAYNASYVASLPWGNSLSLAGSYAQSRVFSDSFIGNTGLNRTLAVRDSFPVPSWGSVAQQHVTLGFDYKSTNNDLLFGGVSVFPTSTQIYEFSAGYGAAIDDRLGSTRWTATVTASPGGLSSENEDATFAAQRTGARAHYLYGKVSVARDFPLPRGFSWSTQVSFQAANANLLPSEEMAFGGSASVRGFAEQTAVRDNGVLAQTELSVPPLMPGLPGRLGIPAIADRLIAFAFLDYGLGRDHATPPGISSRIELASAGPGLRYQVGRNLSVCLTYGVPLLTRGPVAYSRTQFFLEVTL
jgi:hemolysin activation/secretion protein